MKACIDCHINDPKSWHGRYCSSCYQQRYYRIHLDKEREARKIHSKLYYRTAKGRFNHSKKTAVKRGLSFSLSLEQYTALISSPCYYCKGPLNPTGVGLDRKSSALGYIETNVVPCCGSCNRVKNDILSVDEMLQVSKLLSDLRNDRVLASHKIITVDTDDTLVLWDASKYPTLTPVDVTFAGVTSHLCIHQKNINLIRKLAKLGYEIVIWSQTGYDWAQAVSKAIGIDDIVSLYMTKPRYHVDDLPSTAWMGERIYRDPITGDSHFEE